MYWVSYGGGVNSTALGVILCEGYLKLFPGHPTFEPFEFLFADTGDEKPETYSYIEHQFKPYLAKHGKHLHVCRDKESVLERWERLGVVGSRVLRTCTSHAKIRPMQRYRRERDQSPIALVGIDAGEIQRAKGSLPPNDPVRYPLVELGIKRDECKEIIQRAGLCLPIKSGCWHCPFARKREVLDLAKNRPDLMLRIIELEEASKDIHPVEPGRVRAQWGERPAAAWLKMAQEEQKQGALNMDLGSDPEESPCGCYDG